MSAGPNPVDRLEQAATQFKNSGVIQLAVQGLLLEGVARDLRRCDEATLASDPATGSGDMRFDHWFEDQYWADETDGGE